MVDEDSKITSPAHVLITLTDDGDNVAFHIETEGTLQRQIYCLAAGIEEVMTVFQEKGWPSAAVPLLILETVRTMRGEMKETKRVEMRPL